MLKRNLILSCFALGMAMSTSPVEPVLSAEASRGLSDFASINDGRGSTRFLFHWTPTIDAEHFAVSRAILKFELSGVPEERVLRLRLHPLRTPWDAATVRWDDGWETAGGDVATDAYLSLDVDLSSGASAVGWDVTRFVKEVAERGQSSEGYLITTDPEDGVGIRAEDVARFERFSAATVEMKYRKTPPIPREIASQDSLRVD